MAAEMLADIQAYDEAKARIAAGEEIIPAEVHMPCWMEQTR